jgi:hypothetical protein
MMNIILQLLFQGVFPMFLGLGGGQYNAQARTNENAATGAASQYGSSASAEGASLNPFFSQELRATHGYTPGQTNEMLTAAEQSAGGAFGGAEVEINRNAARTGNATSVTKSLDEMARERAKSAAGTSENIAAQDVNAAKQENQAGAAGMQGLYGTNVGAQLGAMKQANEDVSTEQATQGQNWLSQLNQIAKFGTSVAGGITAGAGADQALQNL